MPFQAVDIEGLDGRQHVQDLLTLYRALHHRADRVHWLAMLRAPWCGLCLADLHALAAGDTRRTLWELMHDDSRLAALSADGLQRLLHVRGVMTVAFAGKGRPHPRRWLEGVWAMLGGPACLEAPEALADVDAFFDLVDRLVATRSLTSDNLSARVAELFAPADPQGSAVQLMTIHKSKGLEFDTVIVPGLHLGTGNNDTAMLLWDRVATPDGDTHLLVAPMKAKSAASDDPTVYDFLRKLENQRAEHETERLLYVAATRAIRRLHLVGVAEPDDNKDGGVRPPTRGTLLSLLWDGVARTAFAEAVDALDEAVVEAPVFDPRRYVPPLLRVRQAAVPALLATVPALGAPNRPDAEQALPDNTLELS